MERWLAGDETGVTASGRVHRLIRIWLKEQKGECCWECGWATPHPDDGRIPVEVEHIDGHHLNNRPDNLKLLCPNCHSLTSTFRGRNIGNSTREWYPHQVPLSQQQAAIAQ